MHALAAALALTLAAPVPWSADAAVVGAKKKKKTDPKHRGPAAERRGGSDLTQPMAPLPTQSAVEAPVADTPPAVAAPVEPPKAAAGTWSIVAPGTTGAGQNLLDGGAGFPGVHAAFWHGL